jgi:chromosome segregation ATPase
MFIVYNRLFSSGLIYFQGQVKAFTAVKLKLQKELLEKECGISEFTEQYKQAGLVIKTDTTHLNP